MNARPSLAVPGPVLYTIRMTPFRLASIALMAAVGVSAQTPTMTLRVRVVDTLGKPVADAQTIVERGLNEVVGQASTDANGLHRFTLPRSGGDLQLTVRRIGYQRADHFFRADRDSLSLTIALHTAAQALPTVQVTAAEDLKRKHYHIDAEQIAASPRPIFDALDVVTKLRPDMIDPPTKYEGCGLFDVFVNGKRVVFPPINDALAERQRIARRAGQLATSAMSGRAPQMLGLPNTSLSVQSALASIHPEHIEEMTYVDCLDGKSTDVPHGQNAVFVVLKPGVGFDPGIGSYVIQPSAAVGAQVSAEPVAAYRNRIVGVYDETTGDPLANVEVVDLATGTYARTTATGTATLAFLPDGASTIALRRDGFAELKLDVSISPRDTLPLTVVLSPKRP